jgi:signal transduction histidine kinase
MEMHPTTEVLLEDTERRERAKERLYVIFQLLGWGLFLGVQLASIPLAPDPGQPRNYVTVVASNVAVTAIGMLLSHYVRPFVTRWRWKQLGWRALVPRVIAASFVMSTIWGMVGVGYFHGVLRLPLALKYPIGVVLLIVIVDGTFLFIGWLCLYFFYHLFDRFNRSEIERFRLMTTVKDAELRALKSQVNPHFIFNSLNSLRALIEEDPVRARQAVTQLANLLRYSLQSGQLETVPFEEELSIVNDYLALEQVRHEERLRLRLDVAPDTLQLPIPPMLLQTLVENAVKYGISTRPEGGEIAIVARRENGSLRLQVTNPGELNAPLTRPASTGLGLNNAAERLRLLFGERATLQVRADSPHTVMAEAIIPLFSNA